jgi:ABC-type sugar transport system ATPase subunit
MNEVFEICDAVTIMRGGETVKDGLVSEYKLDDIIFYMTGKRPEVRDNKANIGADTGSADIPVLDIKKLEVYPNVWDISLEAHEGEIIGIAGLQGQGQPEFIRSLLGAAPTSGGTINYKGSPVQFKSPSEAVRNGIGFVSGDRNREAIFPLRSINENICTGRIAKGNLAVYMTPKSLKSFSMDAVEKYSIKIGQLRDTASTLSGGNQQKLVIARWIAMNPSILLLDDPTKGVDYSSRYEIHGILKEGSKNGMTVIMSSSEYEELLDIADKIYVFFEGLISDVLTGERKTAEHVVAAMMGMKKEEEAQGGEADAEV